MAEVEVQQLCEALVPSKESAVGTQVTGQGKRAKVRDVSLVPLMLESPKLLGALGDPALDRGWINGQTIRVNGGVI